MKGKRLLAYYVILLQRQGSVAVAGSPKREILAGDGGLCSGA
jgi:hypothetical protein